MAIHIPKPSKELLQALEDARVLKPAQQEPQQTQKQEPKQTQQPNQGDLVIQLARQTGLSEELVMTILEVMIKRARDKKEGKPAVPTMPKMPKMPTVPTVPKMPTVPTVPTAFVQSKSSEFGMPPIESVNTLVTESVTETNDKYDEALTVGLASGLDIPTAIVLAENSRGRPSRNSWWSETWALVTMFVVSAFWLLLRYLK